MVYCVPPQVRYAGFRAIKAGLQADTYIEAMEITKNKQGYEEVLQNPLQHNSELVLPLSFPSSPFLA
jgi:hypothetical protein